MLRSVEALGVLAAAAVAIASLTVPGHRADRRTRRLAERSSRPSRPPIGITISPLTCWNAPDSAERRTRSRRWRN